MMRDSNVLKGLIREAMERGGLTVGLNSGDFLEVKEFKSGYMVGGYSREYKIALEDIEHMEAVKLWHILNSLYREAPVVSHGLYLGLWIDSGILYMEISKRLTSKKEALKEAAARYQLAVYDCKNDKSIYLK